MGVGMGAGGGNFLNFSFNLFATRVKFHGHTYCQPEIIELEARAPLKKNWFFWLNPYKIEVTITSLTERLELPNFGHLTTFAI